MLDAPKPSNGLGHRLVGDPEPPGDRRVAQTKLLKLKGLRRDLLVDRRRCRIENRRLEGDLRKRSNSLRACPIFFASTRRRVRLRPRPPFRLPLRHLQTLPPPDTPHPPVVHPPAFRSQQRCYPPIPIPTIPRCQRNNPFRQLRLIIGYPRLVPLRRSRLT
jgi:hypothetical protein